MYKRQDIEVEPSASSAIQKMDGTYYNMDFDYAVVVEPHSVSQGLIHVFTYAFNF